MTNFKVKLLDINGDIVTGKTVKACKQGFDKSCYRVDTDASGVAEFNISAWNETIEVSVEGFTTGSTTFEVDIFGNAQPNFKTIRTTFQPLGNAGKSFAKAVDYFKGLGTLATVLIVIAIIILVIFYIRKKGVSTVVNGVAGKIPHFK